jgi:hypothetical protein
MSSREFGFGQCGAPGMGEALHRTDGVLIRRELYDIVGTILVLLGIARDDADSECLFEKCSA